MFKLGCDRSHDRGLCWGPGDTAGVGVKWQGELWRPREEAAGPQKLNSCSKEENREGLSGQIMKKGVRSEGHFGIMVEMKVKR